MNIVIPMAGFGSRFAKIGITTPKPLIDVRGRPMYAWATESMPLNLAKRLIFICLREHLTSTKLEADIQSRLCEIQSGCPLPRSRYRRPGMHRARGGKSSGWIHRWRSLTLEYVLPDEFREDAAVAGPNRGGLARRILPRGRSAGFCPD